MFVVNEKVKMFVFNLVDNWEDLNQHNPYICETRLKCVPESIYWKIYPEEHVERQFITFHYINTICKTQEQIWQNCSVLRITKKWRNSLIV